MKNMKQYVDLLDTASRQVDSTGLTPTVCPRVNGPLSGNSKQCLIQESLIGESGRKNLHSSHVERGPTGIEACLEQTVHSLMLDFT
ncbi:hypothetical protein AOLI_G00278430 [Acnodon oligacanthus]